MPAALTTFAQVAISDLMNAPNAWGSMMVGSKSFCSIRSRVAGSFTICTSRSREPSPLLILRPSIYVW